MRVDYVAVMLSLSTAYLMPLLVVARLGASENAYFFVAWSVALALEGIVLSFSTSLTVEGAANQEYLGEMALATLRRVYMFVLPLVAALVVLAPYVLALFGHEYASQSTTLLRLLALSILVRPVTSLVLATSRVRRRMSLVVRIELAAWLLLLGGSWIALGRWGISGVGVTVIVTQVALALCLLPTLRQDLRSGSATVGRHAP
jgi:O-antigen/teichoic acid export membrane protein